MASDRLDIKHWWHWQREFTFALFREREFDLEWRESHLSPALEFRLSSKQLRVKLKSTKINDEFWFFVVELCFHSYFIESNCHSSFQSSIFGKNGWFLRESPYHHAMLAFCCHPHRNLFHVMSLFIRC